MYIEFFVIIFKQKNYFLEKICYYYSLTLSLHDPLCGLYSLSVFRARLHILSHLFEIVWDLHNADVSRAECRQFYASAATFTIFTNCLVTQKY